MHKMKMIRTLFSAFLLLMSYFGWGQVYFNDFGTTSISGTTYTGSPTLATNVSGGEWTTSASGFTSFSGSTGQALSLNNSSGTPTMTLTLTVAPGYELDITGYNFWRRRSSTGAQNYSITIAGNAAGSGSVPSSGASIGAQTVSVNDITGTFTVVIALSGATGTGTFRLDDFELTGTVNSTGPPATAPTGVTTGTAGTITAFSSIISANSVGTDGGSPITERGVAYSTSTNPTIADNTVTDPGTTGSFDVTLSGLSSSTTYYARAYATNSVGTTYGSDVSFTTNSPAGDTDSDIIENTGFAYPTNLDYTTALNAGPLATSNSIEVAQFTIRDGGLGGDADALTTTLTNLELGIAEHAQLNRVAIFNGSTNVAEVASGSSVSFSGLSLTAPDNGTQNFSIRVSFQSAVTDNAQLQFTITSAAAQAGASLFAATDAGGASTSTSGDNNRIEVTASDLIFDQQPSDVEVAGVMTPSPTVQAVDANVNLDLDFTASVSLSTTGSFDGSATTSVNAVAGVATFNNLIFDAAGSAITLTASSPGLSQDVSGNFDVTNTCFNESFANIPTSSSTSYSLRNWTGDDGFSIEATDARTDQTINGEAIFIRNGSLTINSVSGGIGTLTLTTQRIFSGGSGDLTVTVNSVSVGTIPYSATQQTASINNINVGGTFNIEISTPGNGDRVALDDLTWTCYTPTPQTYTYNGSWSPSDPSGVATNIDNITISSGTAALTADTECDELSIALGATLNLEPNVELETVGNFTNNGSIVLNADNTGYAQLKVNGAVSGAGTATVEQYAATVGWYNMAMPVSGNLDQFGTVNSQVHPNARNIYAWDETNEQWNDIVGNNDGSNVANTAGQGYLVYVGANGVVPSASTIDLIGQMYTSSVINITRNNGIGSNQGWNLIANPFTCALDFSTLTRGNVNNSFAVYDKGAGRYFSYSQSNPDIVSPIVAPMQSFWVRANAANPTINSMTMAANGTVGSTPTFYKNHSVIADRFFLHVFEAADPLKQDEFLLAMIPGTQDANDQEWDAFKRLNDAQVPSLMSVANGDELAINAIDYSPNNLRTKKLQLRFVSSKQNEVYFIELQDSLLTNNYRIELEDLKLRRKHNLNNAAYKFVHDQNAEYRFVLHISPVTTINQGHTHTPVVSGGVNVGINGGVLVLKMDAPAQDVSGALLDLNGRRVMEVEYPAGVEQHLLDVSSLAKGIYLLQLQSANGEEVLKVMIP